MKKNIVKGKRDLPSEIYFEVVSKLEKRIRTTEKYWRIITNIKHPSVKGKEAEIKRTLENPDFIRRSKTDENVYLYYKKQNKHFLCVVVKHSDKQGFIITTYLTYKIKEGELIWQTKKYKK